MRILLAFDGSSPSHDAVNEVARRPWPRATTVRIISVVTPYVPGAGEFVPGATTPLEVIEVHEREAREAAARAADRLSSLGVPVEITTRQGDPATAIVEEAEDWSADLIVVGSHGRTGIQRLLLGSVAQAVVSRARCSVEIVRRHSAVAA
jgi:nucleotide-binding universal stress UspA family protein